MLVLTMESLLFVLNQQQRLQMIYLRENNAEGQYILTWLSSRNCFTGERLREHDASRL